MADEDKKDPPKDDDKKDPPKDDLGDAGKRAIDEERRARREAERTLKEVQDQLKELKDKDKSDSEKLADKIAAAEKERDEAKADLLRFNVAADKGLTPSQARRLVGKTREELEKDADDLLETFGKAKSEDDGKGGDDKKDPPAKPKENLRGGGDPTKSEPEETNPQKLAESVPRL